MNFPDLNYLDIRTYSPGRSDHLQTKVSGCFDPSEIKKIAQAYAVLTGNQGAGDPHVKIFADGWWEDPDSKWCSTLELDKGYKSSVQKIGRKYYHIDIGRGETDVVRAQRHPFEKDWLYNSTLVIRPGTVSDHTKL